ncbi:LamG domain-containing protein [Fibrella sp. WM1]|uniref:LamG domain-containing protein n=1 Tax=Fibrella musci TaxID=3242485 RepID=UPI00352176FA
MKRIYTYLAVLLIGFGTQSCLDHNAAPSISGQLAYYSFTKNANDGSGNNNVANVKGATLIADRYGNAESAYFFNGASSIELPQNVFNLPEFTYAAWVKPTFIPPSQQGGVMVILNSGGPGGDQSMVLANTTVYGWGMWSYTNPQGLNNYAYVGKLPTDLTPWYYVVATRSQDLLKIYVNGELVASQSMTGKPYYGSGSVRTFIGQRNDGTLGFNGSIDEVRIYNRVLTKEEIMQLYRL